MDQELTEKEKLLEKNMAFLREHSSDITFNAVSTANAPALLTVELSENAQPFFIYSSEKAKILLHSRKAPEEEARRQISKWAEGENVNFGGMITVAGFAGMYHVAELLSMMKAGGLLFIADPDPASFRKALEYCDLRKLEKQGVEVIFSIFGEAWQISVEYRSALRNRRTLDNAFFQHLSLFRAASSLYVPLKNEIDRERNIETMNRGAIANHSDEWEQFALMNLPYILLNPHINCLKNSFSGKTAIVAAPGPSLNSSLPYIREIADKCVIFAVGTALKPLLKAGITPDFAIVVDCLASSMKQFEGLNPEKTFLIGHYMLLPELIQLFNGSMFVFSCNTMPGLNSWLEKINALPERFTVGGTVSITAIDAALYLGCSRIILAGLDLALLDDGTSYADGSAYETKRYKEMKTVMVEGNYRKEVLTEKRFSMYIKMLNTFLYLEKEKNKDMEFINATDGGARINHTQLMRPSELQGLHYVSPDTDKTTAIRKLYHNAELPEREKVLAFFRKSLQELDDLAETAGAAEEACNVMFKDEESLKYSGMLGEELSRLDMKIKEENNAYLLVKGALQLLLIDIYSGTGLSEKEETVKKNKKFYGHLKGAAEWVKGLLENTLNVYNIISRKK